MGITYVDETTGKTKIVLLKKGFANPQKLLERLKNDYEQKESYDTEYIESLVAHEMGHAAHIALAYKRTGIEYGKPLTQEECIKNGQKLT